MILQPAVHDPRSELLAKIDREVRQAHPVGISRARAHGLRRAAAALSVVLGVRPQSKVTATVSSPSCATSSAATALSTPPLIATSARVDEGTSRARSRSAHPSALCSASAASSAAWRLAGLRPPSSSAISAAPTRAATSRLSPRSSPTVALPAAIAAPQPLASKPRRRSCRRGCLDRPSRTRGPGRRTPRPRPRPCELRGHVPRPSGRSIWLASASTLIVSRV